MKSLRNYKLEYEDLPSHDDVKKRVKSFKLKLAWKRRKKNVR